MIFQRIDWIRLLFIFILHPYLGLLFIILAYKVLKRKKSRASITLSIFYVIAGAGLILNFIQFLARLAEIEIIIYLLYFLSSFLIIFSSIFILIFINIILKVDFTNKKYILIVFFYAIGCILLHFFPGGITFNEYWAPVYSWTFFIVANIFLTIFIALPIIFYSLKLSRTFTSQDLKRRLRFFLLGITALIFEFYGAILFNTWQEPIFRFIYGLLAIFLFILSGLLIYYGIGRML